MDTDKLRKEMKVGDSIAVCNGCGKTFFRSGIDWKETYIEVQNLLYEHVKKEHSN